MAVGSLGACIKGILQIEWILECNEKPAASKKRFCAYNMKHSKKLTLILVVLGERSMTFHSFPCIPPHTEAKQELLS